MWTCLCDVCRHWLLMQFVEADIYKIETLGIVKKHLWYVQINFISMYNI